MSAVFREFMREGLVATNPFKGLTAGYRCDPTPALSNDERQRLLDAPDFEAAKTKGERQRRLRDKCLLALLFVHGIRQQEARLVKTTDLGTNQGYYTLTVKQKGGATITHRLHPKLHHYIEVYRGEFMGGGGYLFTGLARNGVSTHE
jgi:site-specific recombinase XerD